MWNDFTENNFPVNWMNKKFSIVKEIIKIHRLLEYI